MVKKSHKNPSWWGAKRTKHGDLVTIRAVWGTIEGPSRVAGKLEWSVLMNGGTKLIRIRVGPKVGDFEVL